jgi:hypothetical protein
VHYLLDKVTRSLDSQKIPDQRRMRHKQLLENLQRDGDERKLIKIQGFIRSFWSVVGFHFGMREKNHNLTFSFSLTRGMILVWVVIDKLFYTELSVRTHIRHIFAWYLANKLDSSLNSRKSSTMKASIKSSYFKTCPMQVVCRLSVTIYD